MKLVQFSDILQYVAYSAGGLQAREIKGKVRTKCDLDMVSEVDAFVNSWVAVAIDNEWRLVDVQFAAVSVSGGGAGDWQLIDDTGAQVHVHFDDTGVKVHVHFNKIYTSTCNR